MELKLGKDTGGGSIRSALWNVVIYTLGGMPGSLVRPASISNPPHHSVPQPSFIPDWGMDGRNSPGEAQILGTQHRSDWRSMPGIHQSHERLGDAAHFNGNITHDDGHVGRPLWVRGGSSLSRSLRIAQD